MKKKAKRAKRKPTIASLKRELKACKADIKRYVDMVHDARRSAKNAALH